MQQPRVGKPLPMVIVKKYSNRRLYDTSDSRYITLDELAGRIRSGNDVRVIDAKSNEDLTQATLAQIILESRRAAKLLPTPLLTQMIRMGDDALAEFFSRYMSWALDLYLQARQGAQAMAPLNPFATLPFSASNALARLFSSAAGLGGESHPAPATPPEETPPPDFAQPPPEPQVSEIDQLRQEIDALKQAILDKG